MRCCQVFVQASMLLLSEATNHYKICYNFGLHVAINSCETAFDQFEITWTGKVKWFICKNNEVWNDVLQPDKKHQA